MGHPGAKCSVDILESGQFPTLNHPESSVIYEMVYGHGNVELLVSAQPGFPTESGFGTTAPWKRSLQGFIYFCLINFWENYIIWL